MGRRSPNSPGPLVLCQLPVIEVFAGYGRSPDVKQIKEKGSKQRR